MQSVLCILTYTLKLLANKLVINLKSKELKTLEFIFHIIKYESLFSRYRYVYKLIVNITIYTLSSIYNINVEMKNQVQDLLYFLETFL